MDTILEAEHLRYAYEKDQPVLKDVSFSVKQGEFVALVGKNGSGKSTLAKIIMGLLPGFDGKVKVFGKELNRDNLYDIRKREGIVFQNPDNQFVGSTVEDDIAFGLENLCVPSKDMQGIVESVAKEVGMQDFLAHEPENLSGGQKQRVAIAGILAMKPDFVIFDEATAMLDPKGRKEVDGVIARMREEKPNLTLLAITHNVEEAMACDRILILSKGELLAEGAPNEIFKQEDLLEKAGLRQPFVMRAKKALEGQGISVPAEVSTLEQLEDFLW